MTVKQIKTQNHSFCLILLLHKSLIGENQTLARKEFCVLKALLGNMLRWCGYFLAQKITLLEVCLAKLTNFDWIARNSWIASIASITETIWSMILN